VAASFPLAFDRRMAELLVGCQGEKKSRARARLLVRVFERELAQQEGMGGLRFSIHWIANGTLWIEWGMEESE
jgi:hypothetical protein